MAENEQKEVKGQLPKQERCVCERCGKKLRQVEFYTYKDGSKTKMCKACLTAHIDNFNPTTFEWILRDLDMPYIPSEWNSIRDKAFAKDPYKMTGLTVLGKYIAKMRLNQFNSYGYEDSERAVNEIMERQGKKKEDKEEYEAELKVQLEEGKISEAEYKTLVSTETQNRELPRGGDLITGEHVGQTFSSVNGPSSYEEALRLAKNPFQEQNFLAESEMVDIGADLSKEDKVYLAMKWGRLYTPAQWVVLEKTYKEFYESFGLEDAATAARIDTLKMICKTSLKMNEAIDCGDVDSYQKLSRVYDAMMKSAKFTEAQKKDKEGDAIDSVAAIVEFVEANTGQVPKYECTEPQDIVDTIILDLKTYTRNLIYEDKSLAQEIEKYLKDKQISDAMKKDKQESLKKGLETVELEDEDFVDHKQYLEEMKLHDEELDDDAIEEEYDNRRIQHEE